MKLVNANLKSAKEFANRMMDGEVFYFNDWEYAYYPHEGGFYKHLPSHKMHVHVCLCLYEDIQIEAKWYEDIEKPVICWVSDNSREERDCVDLIIAKVKGGYYTGGTYWKYATPVTADDLYKGEIK